MNDDEILDTLTGSAYCELCKRRDIREAIRLAREDERKKYIEKVKKLYEPIRCNTCNSTHGRYLNEEDIIASLSEDEISTPEKDE